MVKQRHDETRQESSKATMAIMAIGGLLVAGLVVWALTRTVQPVPEASTSTSMSVPVAGVEPTTSPNPALPAPQPGTNTAAGTPQPQQTSTYQPNPPSADENATVPRISVADLKAKVDAKQVTVIDVRQDMAYTAAHIPGSLHFAMATVEANLASIPKDKPIVTYCT